MRIAIVSTPFIEVPPRAYGGTELVVHELVRELSAAGHAVTLFATGNSTAPDVRAVFPEPIWPPNAAAERRHCVAAVSAIAREGYDVVHGHAPSIVPLASALRAPLVYTIHHDRDPRLTASYARNRHVRYVAISARQAELVPELGCAVVHHGLDPARYPLGNGDRGDAVFLGRLSPCKGPDLAVVAAAAAGVPLRVAGAIHEEGDCGPRWSSTIADALSRPGVLPLGPRRGGAEAAAAHERARVAHATAVG